MAFTYKEVATLWNNSIKTNETGENAVMLAEDLSNLVDAGTYASNNVGLKHHYRNMIVGVRNYMISKMLEENQFDILRTKEEFGSGLQRIMAKDFFTPQESHILNLVSDGRTSYHDGKYYGLDANAKVYLQTETFKVVHSRAEDFEGTMFTKAEDLMSWLGLVAVTERNTITAIKNNLEKRLVNKMIVDTVTGNRVVHLIARFNDMTGANETLATLKADRQKWAYFSSYCKEVIARLVDYVKQPNKKYNNGDNLTFCNDASVVMLTEFKTDIEYLAQPIEYNPNGNTVFKTVPWWQSSEDDMLPSYGTSATIKTEAETHYDMIVACIYDRQGIGAESILDNKVTIESVQEEGFNNYHDHQAIRYYVDNRLTSIVLMLD